MSNVRLPNADEMKEWYKYAFGPGKYMPPLQSNSKKVKTTIK